MTTPRHLVDCVVTEHGRAELRGLSDAQRAREILEDELISAMGLTGVTSISQVTPKHVCKAEAVTAPHEMSGWVNMQVGRIL